MTELFDVLEICLQEMERGADINSVLKRFPEHASELRPILETASKARSMVSAEPSPVVMRRSRAKVMQRAAELREAKSGQRRRVIPVFSRLAISFALTALFLASGAGLVNASASALPGENLYPVKRGWESIRLFFIFDPQLRNMLEDEYENERLHEVNELLAEGRHEVIQFAGVYMQVNGVDYVSGLKVILPEGAQVPADGDAIIVTGRTNTQGFIEISGIEMLPAGSVVPLGSPIAVEVESESESGEENTNADASQPEEYELSGILQVISESSLLVNGMPVVLNQTKVKGQLCVGMEVEVIGYYADDSSFIALEIEGEGQCAEVPSSGGSNENSGSNGGDSGGDDNSNSGDDANDDDGGDDNGDDGGGDDDTGNDNGDDGGGDDDNGNDNDDDDDSYDD